MAITIESLRVNQPQVPTNFGNKLVRTNQIVVEQSKNPPNSNIKLKLQNEEYSEQVLQQDIRWRHYANNIDMLVLKDEVVTRKYYEKLVR